MCIGSPAVVLEVKPEESIAVVDYGDGIPREVIIGISKSRVKPGSIVIIHAGVIISEIDINDILEQLEFFKETLGEEDPLTQLYMRVVEAYMRMKGGGNE